MSKASRNSDKKHERPLYTVESNETMSVIQLSVIGKLLWESYDNTNWKRLIKIQSNYKINRNNTSTRKSISNYEPDMSTSPPDINIESKFNYAVIYKLVTSLTTTH